MPAVAADHLAAEQLEEQVGATSGGVFLLARGHVAGAHRPGVVLATEADAEAAFRCSGEAEAVLVEAEVRLQLRGPVAGAEPQVRVRRVGVDLLARVQLPVGVPGALELTERIHQLGPVHLLERPAVRLAVAVLARERAAVGEHEVGRLLVEAAEALDPLCRLQVEADPRVRAALPVALDR